MSLGGRKPYKHVRFVEALSVAEAYSISEQYGGDILWVHRTGTQLNGIEFSEGISVQPGMNSFDIEQLWAQHRDYSTERVNLYLQISARNSKLRKIKNRIRDYELRLESNGESASSKRYSENELNYLNAQLEQLKKLEQHSKEEVFQGQSKWDSLDGLDDSVYGKLIRLDQMLVKIPPLRRMSKDDRILDVSGLAERAAKEKFIPKKYDKSPPDCAMQIFMCGKQDLRCLIPPR